MLKFLIFLFVFPISIDIRNTCCPLLLRRLQAARNQIICLANFYRYGKGTLVTLIPTIDPGLGQKPIDVSLDADFKELAFPSIYTRETRSFLIFTKLLNSNRVVGAKNLFRF